MLLVVFIYVLGQLFFAFFFLHKDTILIKEILKEIIKGLLERPLEFWVQEKSVLEVLQGNRTLLE